MQPQTFSHQENFYVISVVGEDQVGIVSKVTNRTITRDHMKGILYCLGISDLDLRKGT